MVAISTATQAIMGLSKLPCIPQVFQFPDLFGAEFLKLEANLVSHYSAEIPQGVYTSHHPTLVDDISFCNVSIEYTHPGYNDRINTQVWLPMEGWNGRMQASGGSGQTTGLIELPMAGSVSQGFATVSTDGGHTDSQMEWVLSSPGNVNWGAAQNFAGRALNDASIIGKSITKDFYGRRPFKSYWNGCSMGGRQGLMMAQRYPTAYDGILAAAPAINLPKFVIAEYWPQMVMNEAGEYPPPCELQAITSAAIEACDILDGVVDGIVSAPDLCHFDARSMIGEPIFCQDLNRGIRISELAAKVANEAWRGPRREDGSFLWWGQNHETKIAGSDIAPANTYCDEDGCHIKTFEFPEQWIKFWLKKDPNFIVANLTRDEAGKLFHESQSEYRSIIGTDDPDLTAFKEAGGKMITWHGLADPAIMANGTRHYFEATMDLDPDVQDYYRHFEAPGVSHCFGGPGPFPGVALDQLMEWVEEGAAPHKLYAASHPNEFGTVLERDLCMYPLKGQYRGVGDVTAASSYECL